VALEISVNLDNHDVWVLVAGWSQEIEPCPFTRLRHSKSCILSQGQFSSEARKALTLITALMLVNGRITK
jgi:hypothetical protein